MKIPVDLANAAEASFPTLVEAGKLFLRIRRTQARGGSNSTAEGGPLVESLVDALVPDTAVILSDYCDYCQLRKLVSSLRLRWGSAFGAALTR